MSSAPSIEPRDQTVLPQFTLRTMFAAVALICVLLALEGLLGPIASAVLVSGLALVGLHVAGNALGTTLRDQTSEKRPFQHDEQFSEITQTAIRSLAAAPPPRLSQRTRLSWLSPIVICLGAIIGAWLAADVLVETTNAHIPGVVVGSISGAVLGGFFGFLGGAFLEMALTAWWQATSNSNAPKPETSTLD
jgi:hypothetical protein